MEQESLNKLLILPLAAALCLTGVDIVMEFNSPIILSHVILELCIFLCCALPLVLLVKIVAKKEEQISLQNNKLEQTKSKFQSFSTSFINLVDSEFDKWKLTKSEKEIGYYLLKGMSLEKIAEARQTSPSTTRKQSMHLYRKSGISGRHELSAFFIEDLLSESANSVLNHHKEESPIT